MIKKAIHGFILLIAITPIITYLLERSYIGAGLYIAFFLHTLNPIITRTMTQQDTHTFLFKG